MMDPIVIITPCSRPENLPRISESIDLKTCRWFIVFDAETVPETCLLYPNTVYLAIKGGISGNMQRNRALDEIPSPAWVYILDDDNILHPAFIKSITRLIKSHQKRRAFVFSQDVIHQHRIRHITPNRISVGNIKLLYITLRQGHITPNRISMGNIDQAQYIIHTDLIGTYRYEQTYTADGTFVENIYKIYPKKFLITKQILAYYNYLRP